MDIIWRFNTQAEINKRVNYGMKRGCNYITEDLHLYDSNSAVDKYAMSFVTCNAVDFGMTKEIHAWNNHAVTGETFKLCTYKDF